MMRRIAFAFGAAASIVLLAAMPARAHASLLGSEPAAGEELARAPTAVVLELSEEADPSASQIRVLSTDGRLVSRGAPVASGELRLQVALGDVGKGVYTVTWRVLSRVDGHVTGGTFAFGVGESPDDVARGLSSSAQQRTPGPTVIGVAGRWLFYAGIALVIGAAWVAMFAHGSAPPATARFLWFGWASAALGAIGIAAAQRSETGIAWSNVFDTSIGTAFIARAIPLGAMLFVFFGLPSIWRRAAVAGVVALGAIVTHVANGHAASGSPAALQIALQSVHFAAVAAWIGGLAMLALSLRAGEPTERARAVSRYSTAALWAVVVLAIAGGARAFVEIEELGLLWSTSYGRFVLVKIGLLAVLIVLGAVNRYRMVPRAGEDHRGLTRIASLELALAAVVFVTTGALTSVAPAKASRVERTAAVRATGSDVGTTMRATLTADPGGPGPNRFELALRDYDSNEPILADEVRGTFRLVGEDVEPSSLLFTRTPDGYTATGSVLAVPGPWEVTILVRRGTSAVEIRMPLFPLSPLQRSVIPGDPTIYTIGLPEGRSVQMYLDPARAGKAEVHATWFETGFKEFKGLEDMVMVATERGQGSQALSVRKLSPGHAVATVELTAGVWRFDASAVTAEGARLWGMFEVTVPT